MPKITVTAVRPQLARWIEHVRRSPTETVILTAHGREVAALVSVEALRLIWAAQDERRVGPIDPATGRPFGAAWVAAHFGGHYERHRDPERHLHPRREDAPWLGRPFDWPPAAMADPGPDLGPNPRPEPEPEPEPLPAFRRSATRAAAPEAQAAPPAVAPAPRRPWWRRWRVR